VVTVSLSKQMPRQHLPRAAVISYHVPFNSPMTLIQSLTTAQSVLLNSVVKQATITRQLRQRSYTPLPNLRMEFHIPDMSTNRPVLCLMSSCVAVPIRRIISCFPSTVRDCKPALTVRLERSQVHFVQPECPKNVCMFLLLHFLSIFSTIQ